MSCITVAPAYWRVKGLPQNYSDTKFQKAISKGGNYVVIKMQLSFARRKILDYDVTV